MSSTPSKARRVEAAKGWRCRRPASRTAAGGGAFSAGRRSSRSRRSSRRQLLPREQVRIGVDDAVVAHAREARSGGSRSGGAWACRPRRPCCRRTRSRLRPSRARRYARAARRRRGERSRTRSPVGRGARRGCRRSCSSPTRKSVPSVTARTGAPSGAKMSFPWCQPVSARAAPKSSENDAGP